MPNSLDYYRRRLRLDKHALDDELEEHALLLDEIAQEEARRNTAALKAKDQLAKLEGRLADDIKAGDPSLSIAKVDAQVRRHPERREAMQAWLEAREAHEQWSALRDAWKTRGHNIRNLSDLYTGQYFALNSTRTQRAQNRSRDYEYRERPADRQDTRRRVVE